MKESLLTPSAARSMFREGTTRLTTGWCSAHTQVNLIAVPADWAHDVALFCRRNPRPCPLLDITGPGARSTALAPGADLRTDLPRYRVWENGVLVDEPRDVVAHWRDDMVAFLIGSGFTLEAALRGAGVPLRHLDQGRNAAMYRTNRYCRPGGRLWGPVVVSMRPVPARLVGTAIRAGARTPGVRDAQGGPFHIGDPAALGIADLNRPDYGDPVRAEPGDVPVFWACGVTVQAALTASRPPFAITHAPGYMFITDIRDIDQQVA